VVVITKPLDCFERNNDGEARRASQNVSCTHDIALASQMETLAVPPAPTQHQHAQNQPVAAIHEAQSVE